MEQALFVFAEGDVDVFEAKGFGGRDIDFQGGEQGFGGLVIEPEFTDDFDIAECGCLCGEIAEGFDGAIGLGAGDLFGDRLDFITNDDDAVDGDVRVVVAELGKVAVCVFADEAK